jgi:hypothetical protein
VVDSWPSLPEAVRAGIVAMVRVGARRGKPPAVRHKKSAKGSRDGPGV